jgi:hypothetical protein
MPAYQRPQSSSNTAVFIAAGVLLVVAVIGVYLAVAGTSQPNQPAAEKVAKAAPSPDKKKSAVPGPAKKTDTPDTSAAWVTEVRAEVAVARSRKPITEPARGLLTQAEYTNALQSLDNFKSLFRVEEPTLRDDLCYSASFLNASAVMPETVRVFQREGFTRVVRMPDEELERFINIQPDKLRPLVNKQLRAELRARLPWEGRKEAYQKLAVVTGQRESWSLLHPFDDLNKTAMAQVLEVANRAVASGLKELTANERQLLLSAGAIDFVERLIPIVK